MNQQLTALFSPLTIKGMTLKNRAGVSAMVTNFNAANGDITERFIAYHEAKAKGGYGLIITEDYQIAPNVAGFSNIAGLWKDEQIAMNKELTRRVHKYGAKIIAQIYHAGRFMAHGEPVAPSVVLAGNEQYLARELRVDEIHTIQDQFANAARIAQAADFDGIELHGAHIYLIAQFLSPLYNKRHDEYGGSIYNRTRFARETIAKIRKVVGEDYPIFFRIGAIEYEQGGIGIEETKAICCILEEAGVDAINSSGNTFVDQPETGVAPSVCGKGFWLDNPEELKKALHIPVIAVGGRLNDPFMANAALASGKCDVALMSRASIADPEIINKSARGEYDDIRYCIGCNQGCLGEVVFDKPMRCLVNPLMGFENVYDLSIAAESQKILVIGGGIAGCEAAYVAAKKGHQVTLVEKSDHLGGQWLTAAKPVGKAEFATFVQWQSRQLKKLNVDIHINTAFAKELLSEHYDVIIVATGSQPIVPKIEGIELSKVVSAEDILESKVIPGKNIVVIGGGQTGLETADLLAYHYERQVTVVEMLPELKPFGHGEQFAESLLKKRLQACHVKILTGTSLEKVTEDEVILQGNEQIVLKDIDQVVLAIGVRKNTEVIDLLGDYSGKILYVGDANQVKSGYLNIQEAFEMALTI